MDISEFLEARIAEDEEQAKNCQFLGWFPGNKYGMTTVSYARVLAECAAKRAILEHHTTHTYTDEEPGFSMELWDCMCQRQTDKPCPTVGALAAVYAHHPNYQQGWAA